MQGDLVKLIGKPPSGSLPAQAGQAVLKRLLDRLRLGLAREFRQRFQVQLRVGGSVRKSEVLKFAPGVELISGSKPR